MTRHITAWGMASTVAFYASVMVAGQPNLSAQSKPAATSTSRQDRAETGGGREPVNHVDGRPRSRRPEVHADPS